MRPRRSYAAGIAAIALAATAGLGAAVAAIFWFEPACVADYSEATIVAPGSMRGRLLCSVTDGELDDTAWPIYTIAALAVVFTIAAAVLWLRRRPLGTIAACLVGAVVLPWLAVAAIAVTPADCTDAQWQRYGDSGCERNEELRPGLGQYW